MEYTININGQKKRLKKDDFEKNYNDILKSNPDARISVVKGGKKGSIPLSKWGAASKSGYTAWGEDESDNVNMHDNDIKDEQIAVDAPSEQSKMTQTTVVNDSFAKPDMFEGVYPQAPISNEAHLQEIADKEEKRKQDQLAKDKDRKSVV